MTDDRPEPRYGQYAPPAPAPEPTPAPTPAPVIGAPPPVVAPPNRTRDIVITTVLLLLGVFDVVTSFSTFANFAPELTKVYEQFGIGGTASEALAVPFGLAINIVRVSLLVVTIVISLLLIARHRRAFWVPLAGYVLAGLVTSILVLTVMVNDPAYLAWMSQNQ